MAKVIGLYNKYFFEKAYKALKENDFEGAVDGTGTYWHIGDIEAILVDSHGYRKAANGRLI